MKTNSLVLASSSAYRRELLKKLQFDFICASPDINESKKTGESATSMASRLAQEKATALVSSYPEHYIIASDQVAMLEHTQLTKPGNSDNAVKQLQLCSGHSVKFHTSVCVLNSATNELKSAIDTCIVHFKNLTKQQIINYVHREQPYDCAGSFKSEGLGIALFESVQGEDPNALIGLPLIKLIHLLAAFGINVLSKTETTHH